MTRFDARHASVATAPGDDAADAGRSGPPEAPSHSFGISFSTKYRSALAAPRDCGQRECEYNCWERTTQRRAHRLVSSLVEWVEHTGPPGSVMDRVTANRFTPLYLAQVNTGSRDMLRVRARTYGAGGVVIPITYMRDLHELAEFIAIVTDHRVFLGDRNRRGPSPQNLARKPAPWSEWARSATTVMLLNLTSTETLRTRPHIEEMMGELFGEFRMLPMTTGATAVVTHLLRTRLDGDTRYRVAGLNHFQTSPISRSCECRASWNQIRIGREYRCMWCGEPVTSDNTGLFGNYESLDQVAAPLKAAGVEFDYSADKSALFIKGSGRSDVDFEEEVLAALSKERS